MYAIFITNLTYKTYIEQFIGCILYFCYTNRVSFNIAHFFMNDIIAFRVTSVGRCGKNKKKTKSERSPETLNPVSVRKSPPHQSWLNASAAAATVTFLTTHSNSKSLIYGAHFGWPTWQPTYKSVPTHSQMDATFALTEKWTNMVRMEENRTCSASVI